MHHFAKQAAYAFIKFVTFAEIMHYGTQVKVLSMRNCFIYQRKRERKKFVEEEVLTAEVIEVTGAKKN